MVKVIQKYHLFIGLCLESDLHLAEHSTILHLKIDQKILIACIEPILDSNNLKFLMILKSLHDLNDFGHCPRTFASEQVTNRKRDQLEIIYIQNLVWKMMN
jgi:hypothetical protein